GTAIRSTWRPTRQRPGVLEWQGSGARLELEVEKERPFVPHFVEAQEAKGRRKKPFPSSAQELIVAATERFLSRDQSVLIYCPIKSSVDATAKCFLDAQAKVYCALKVTAEHEVAIAD